MTKADRPTKRLLTRRQNEQAILEAAEKVFAEAGFGGATMQLIADMAGLPKANLHYYFATKEELYRKVVARILEQQGHREGELREAATLGSNEAVREAVKAGIGLAILSACSVAEDIRQGRLVALKLEELDSKRSFFLVHRRNKALAPAASALMEHVLQALQTGKTDG